MEEHEWELAKENVQPLRQGRTMSSLTKGLHSDPKDESFIKENQRAFELELRTYEGDDPLDVWYRYIKWTEQHFPKGGQDGHLPKLIEKCLQKFQTDQLYTNDPRFVKLWIMFSNFSESPTDVFAYMFDNGIGVKVSQLYVEWATMLEIVGNTKRADSIYTEGLNRLAEPRDLLLHKQELFQNRLAKNITLQMADSNHSEMEDTDQEEKREVLSRLKPTGGNKVGTTRTGAVSVGSAGRLKDQRGALAPKQVPSKGFTVYTDENVSHKPQQTHEWASMPTRSVDSKENDKKPGVWTGAKYRQGRVASETKSAKEAFKIHEDLSAEVAATVTPMKTTMMSHKPLSAVKAPQQNNMLTSLRQGQGVPDLNAGIPMYPKDRIYNGMEEFSFEELRAIQHWKKLEAAKKEAERLRLDEERTRNEAMLKAKLDAQENALKAQASKLEALESLLKSQLIIPRVPETGQPVDEMMESETIPSQSLSGPVSKSKAVSAKQELFTKKMEEAAVTMASNASSDFVTPTNLSGVFPCKGITSSGSSQSNLSQSGSGQRMPIFNSLSTYSSIGSSGGSTSLKPFPRGLNSSLNQSSTRSTPASSMIEDGCGRDSTDTGIGSRRMPMSAPSPTVCTKEAVQLVQGMFCAELEQESLLEDGMETEIGILSSGIQFEICVDKTDHNLQMNSGQKQHNSGESMPVFIHQDNIPRPPEQCVIYQDENQLVPNMAAKGAPFEVYRDEKQPLVTNFPTSSKKEGRKFGDRLSFPAFEDVEMTDTERGDFAVAHAKEDVTIASLSTFSINACAASTPFHGQHKNETPKTTESMESEVSLPSGVDSTSQMLDENTQTQFRHLSPIFEGSGESSSNSDHHTKSHSQVSGADSGLGVRHSVHQTAASVHSVIHEESEDNPDNGEMCDTQLLDATCHHIIDTSACMPEETEALLSASISTHTRDPFDQEAIRAYLSQLQPPVSSYENYHELIESVKEITENGIISVDSDSMELIAVNKCLGKGGYAQVYEMNKQSLADFDDHNFEAMKVQKPPCYWEFYISSEIQRRLKILNQPMNVRSSVMSVNYGYFNSTMSLLVMKLLEYGSLLNLVNLYKSDPKLMSQVEPFACLVTVELLHLFEQLHKCHIIHGDVKPDNFLLIDLPVVCENSKQPKDVFGSKLRVFCLTDFGQTIDMHMFPKQTTFKTKVKTQGFECIEMRTDRPWTYQADLFGLAGTIHVLLFGSYMKVFIEKGIWKTTGSFVRKWNVPLWKRFFHELLNIPSCDCLPDLGALRAEFEEYFCSNLIDQYNEWARKVQVLLTKEGNLDSTNI